MDILKSDLSDSVKDALNKRMNSSVYGTFILYWIIFHWNFVFTIFFVGEDKIWNSTGTLKNDYLTNVFFNYQSLSFYIWWILPLIFTYLTIWVFPKYINIPAYKKERDDEAEKKIFNLGLQKKIVAAQTLLETEKVKKIDAEVQQIQKVQEIKDVDPTIDWSRDYEKFEKSNYLIRYLNFMNGYYGGSRYVSQFSSDEMSYFDALGLVELNSNSITAITPKGKYFARRLKETPG